MSPRVERWSIHLPYPKPPLSLNDRMHWAKRHKLNEQIKGDVQQLARSLRMPHGLDRVRVTLCWVPAVRRRRDTDNPTPTLKAAIDGLVAYGLVADDDSTHVRSGVVITAPPTPPMRPGLWLEITDLTADLSAVPANPNGAGETK